MIYVYDVLVNLNEDFYDFYDWEESDNYFHVRRVPLYKVNSEDYNNLYFKSVRVNEEFMSCIHDKTQIFSSRNIEVIPYAVIFTNGENAVMVEFNEKGFSLKKSKFLVNEEMEILEISNSMKVSKLDYNIVKNKNNVNKMIRSEKRILDDILEELEVLKDDQTRVDYLYYEWFSKHDGDNKYESLVSELKKGFTNKHVEFLNLLNLLTIKK